MAHRPRVTTGTGRVAPRRERGRLPLLVHYRLTPWWLKILAIFVLSRLVTTIMMVALARAQGPNPWTGGAPGYFDYANLWDGRWYQIVAEFGYPRALPLTADGHVDQNAWAFMPGYPAVVRGAMFVTGLPWQVAAVLVSLAFGLAAALMLYRLLRLKLDQSTSMFAVVLFCVAPTAPLLQVAYAESMYLFLLTLALWLLLRRRYLTLIPVVAVMAFVRPSGLAFALALGLHIIHRWWVRARDPFPAAERVRAVAVTIVSGIAGLAWPAIAALATGSLTAYTDTELSWRAPYIGYLHLVPFSPWLQGARWWFADFLGASPWLGYLALALLIAIFALSLALPAVRRLGTTLRLWLVSYALYLLAVFFPQSSTFRLLMPMFPLLGAIASPRSRVYRVVLVVVSVLLQLGWLLVCWGIDGADWSPP